MNSESRHYLSMSLLALALSMLILAIFAAINSAASQNEPTSLDKAVQVKEASETTDEIFTLGDFPDFIRLASQDIRQAYEFAADIDNHAILKVLHCYCGCEEGAGHNNLLDCYIKKLLPGNRAVYAEHAFGCRSCVTQVLDTRKYLSEGKSLAEIEGLIDDKYLGD